MVSLNDEPATNDALENVSVPTDALPVAIPVGNVDRHAGGRLRYEIVVRPLPVMTSLPPRPSKVLLTVPANVTLPEFRLVALYPIALNVSDIARTHTSTERSVSPQPSYRLSPYLLRAER